jgi:hypothetical protein
MPTCKDQGSSRCFLICMNIISMHIGRLMRKKKLPPYQGTASCKSCFLSVIIYLPEIRVLIRIKLHSDQ